jgi:predicted transcriptional regulator
MVTRQVREAIVRAFHDRKLSYGEIAELLAVGEATVSRVLRRHRETKSDHAVEDGESANDFATQPRNAGAGSPTIPGQLLAGARDSRSVRTLAVDGSSMRDSCSQHARA